MPDEPVVEYQMFFRSDDSPQVAIFTLRYEREGDQWTGVCEELGTSTYGRDRSQLRVELAELVVHDLNSLEADGERERFFERHDIEVFNVPRHILERARDVLRPQAPTASPSWVPQHTPELAAAHV